MTVAAQTLLVVALLVEAVAVAVSVLLLVDATRDVAATRDVGNGRALVAEVSLRTEALRLVSLISLMLATAITTVVVWPRPEASGSLIATLALYDAANVAILLQSLEVYNLRRRLFDGAYHPDTPSEEHPA